MPPKIVSLDENLLRNDEKSTISIVLDYLYPLSADSMKEFTTQCLMTNYDNETSADILKESIRRHIHVDVEKYRDSFTDRPELCRWLYRTGDDYDQAICPRNLGIEDDTSAQALKLHGRISRDRLRIVDITNVNALEKNCRKNDSSIFQACPPESDIFVNIKVLFSEDRSDSIPWTMPRSVVFGERSSHPEKSIPFAPHLVAIKNAFVNSWGYIFDYERWYIHGGCPDRAWHHPTFEFDMATQIIARFNEPVLSLMHPFSTMFYHEFIEIHSMLLMSLPLLEAMPNISIVMNKPLVNSQLFPLLKALNINVKNYNFLAIKEPGMKSRKNSDKISSKSAIVYAPYIITPISLWCQYVSRGTTRKMREAYSRLPYWTSPGNGIIVYDRYNLRPKRSLEQGPEVYAALNHRYGKSVSVKQYLGNETLEETVRLFRRSSVFIAAHGGGEANMIFMPSRGVVVEIRPDNWPVPCFIDLANNIGLDHYLLSVESGGRAKEMSIDLKTFLPELYRIIDNFYKT